MVESTRVLVVGGGVCGVYLATLLRAGGVPHVLAESRTELGGRVRTMRRESPPLYADLGPAWVWPHQRHLASLIRRGALAVFEQHTEGDLVFESAAGAIQRHAMATMGGSLRVVGGMRRLVDLFAAELNPRDIWRQAHLQRLELTASGRARARFGDGRELEADAVVLALPPRVVARSLEFAPSLPSAYAAAMRAVPTWMAAHAKAVAFYDTAFWRDHGLNGDGVSHRGPLGELHDATPHDNRGGVLFGFFARPAPWRRANADGLDALIRQQLANLYGDAAAEPTALEIIDWADDPRVATPDDDVPLREHPSYGPLPTVPGPWGDVLHLSGSELATDEGGFVEGALVAATDAAAKFIP